MHKIHFMHAQKTLHACMYRHGQRLRRIELGRVMKGGKKHAFEEFADTSKMSQPSSSPTNGMV